MTYFIYSLLLKFLPIRLHKTTPVGKNTLGTMIKRMRNNAGISEGFTNHSLHAYGATTLFHAEVPPMPSARKPDNVTFLLNNRTFSGCTVTLSGQAMSGSTQEPIEEKRICTETLKDINVDNIFDD